MGTRGTPIPAVDSIEQLLRTARVNTGWTQRLAEAVGAALPMAERLPAWTVPILEASPGMMIVGALGLRLWGVPIEVTQVQLQPPVRLAAPHPLVPGHTVVPVALNDHWTYRQREEWLAEHGPWS